MTEQNTSGPGSRDEERTGAAGAQPTVNGGIPGERAGLCLLPWQLPR
jgi:hypothetical protein